MSALKQFHNSDFQQPRQVKKVKLQQCGYKNICEKCKVDTFIIITDLIS